MLGIERTSVEVAQLERAGGIDARLFHSPFGDDETTGFFGGYQITKRTYGDLQKQLGLNDFSPDTQDAMAAHLIVQGGALPYLLKGDLEGAVERLRGTWASLPGAGKQSHTDMDTFRARYNRYLNAVNGAQP